MYQVPVYQVYQEDQDQISDATYISDVVFLVEAYPSKTDEFLEKSLQSQKKFLLFLTLARCGRVRQRFPLLCLLYLLTMRNPRQMNYIIPAKTAAD